MKQQLRVLVVEDEWLIAEDHSTNLITAGYVVVGPVPSVAEALHLIGAEHIDLAMLDIGLNGETSFPIADELSARNIPFFFLSGFVKRDVPRHLSGCRIVSKPALPNSIVSALVELQHRGNTNC
jgi:DNA-binding response OmpR family regulator